MEGKLKLLKFSIKRELVTSDSEQDLEPESGHERNAKEVKLGRIINGKRIKQEVSQSSNPESEDNESEAAILSTTQAQPYDAMGDQQQSDDDSDVPNGSRVTVLQDIRLTPKLKTPLEKLKIMYPGLKKIDPTVELELSDSDEVYFFRMPKHVNPKLLKKMEINLETACKLNLDEKYIITPIGKDPDPKLVISTNSKVLQFRNNIIMKRCTTSEKESGVVIPEIHDVSLPENVKTWHPFFGSGFQQKIVLSDNIEKGLDTVIATSLKAHKSKKKKEKTKRNEEEDDIPNQEIFNLLDSHMFLTNNDRIKKEASDDSAFGSSSSSCTLKRKNKKEKGNTSDKYIKQEKELIGNETSGESNITPKRKKLKHLYHDSWSDISSIKKETGVTGHIKVEGSTASSKVDKKNSSIINSTLIPDIVSTPKFKLNVSTIASEKSSSGKKLKKSKKEKKQDEDGTSEKEKLISDLLNDITVELNTSTSKKKKQKHEKHDFDKTVKLEF